MGQKKITDLTLISSVTDALNIPSDDGIQTYRATALQFKNYILPDLGITLAKLAAEVTQKLVPIGAILNMPTSEVPTGFLKCNGAAISRTTYADLFAKLVTTPGYSAQTFTVTIATPAVVTKSSHGFTGGERLRLSTTGALPTGLNNSTDYFVYYVDANTFRLQTISDVIAGTFVNTSGTQSGTHSYTRSLWGLGDGSTTFNVPDLRGVFQRAWDDSRGLDASRAIASMQMDAFQGHGHNIVNSANTNTSGMAWCSNQADSTGVSRGSNTTGRNFEVTQPRTYGSYGDARIANETRPINYAMMPVIRY